MTQSEHLVRIPDQGITEQLVVFADQAVLDQVKPGDRVLDVGCGHGVFSEKMAARGGIVTGIDIVSEEIEAAKSRGSDVTYLCMAAENLQDLHREFDLVVSRFCFHHLSFPESSIGIRSRMAPGSRLFVVDCYRGFWSLRGRLSVLWSSFRQLGPARFLRVAVQLGYFFAPDRFEHVKSDIKRLREQKRYTLDEVRSFYHTQFPGSRVSPLGCAFSLSWSP